MAKAKKAAPAAKAAAGKKATRPSGRQASAPSGASKWQNLLDDMQSGQGGPFFFPGEGKTRLRLVAQEGTSDEFFAETRAVFRGKEKVKYIVLAYVVGSSSKELPEEMKGKITPVVVSKTVLRGILSLLAEGYDLLDPEDGHGLTLIRSGKGLDTSYNVMPSPTSVVLPDDLEFPVETLEELAQMYYTQSLERSQNSSKSGEGSGDEEEEEPTKKRRGSSGGGDW